MEACITWYASLLVRVASGARRFWCASLLVRATRALSPPMAFASPPLCCPWCVPPLVCTSVFLAITHNIFINDAFLYKEHG